jgi:hypothetical protein
MTIPAVSSRRFFVSWSPDSCAPLEEGKHTLAPVHNLLSSSSLDRM